MIRLSLGLAAWGTAEFEEVFKHEVSRLPHELLPLQQALSMGSDVVASPVVPIVLSANDLGEILRVRSGIMFQSVLAGCSCADDPTTASENAEYCELQFDIDKRGAQATVTLL